MGKKEERPPVVVVVGHIDHGKSTLLDYLRQTKLVESEVGGITQHIGAYEISHQLKDGRQKILTFIDTPGHAAFNEMRERGASIADLAVLVVSAEEGVKPQTLEALAAIKRADIPFVVAITKIDRPEANVDRTKQSLAENEIFLEGYGGKIPGVAVSAKTGAGIDELLELLVLSAELVELSGDREAPGSGFILESRRDRQSGIIANIIVKDGTVRAGDFLLAGQTGGKIRGLRDGHGQTAKAVSFSAPAETLGWDDLPPAGAPFFTCANKKEMEKTLAMRRAVEKMTDAGRGSPAKAATTNLVVVPTIVKGDTTGTSEAAARVARTIATERVTFKIVATGVGPVSESDVKALGAGGIIIGFGVAAEKAARELAAKHRITIESFPLIHELTDWLSKEAARRQPKITRNENRGRARLLRLFNNEKGRQVVGGVVLEGTISEGESFKIIRRESEIGYGKIMGLEQQKLKATAVAHDNQFGSLVESKITLAPGDVLQTFAVVEE